MTKPVVVLRGDLTGVSGYSSCTRTYGEALLKAGVNIYFENSKKEETNPVLSDFWTTALNSRSVKPNMKVDIKIHHETPNFYKPHPTAINVAYTTFETSGIPNQSTDGLSQNNWVSQLNMMDCVLVPSAFNKRTFKTSGVTIPIEVIPHIVKVPKITPSTIIDVKDSIRALSIFQWNPRKDPTSTLIAFYRASIPKSRLILKTYITNFDAQNLAIVDSIQAVKRSFYKTPEGVVTPILDKLTEEEIFNLYFNTDVYITTTRGEGFGLPIAEAMACGVPVIAPAGSALEDYVTPETAYVCDHTYVPCHGMQHLPYGKVYSPCTDWMQVNINSVKDCLLQADLDKHTTTTYKGEQLTKLQYKGIHAKEVVTKLFNEEVVTKEYVRILQQLFRGKKK